MTRQRRGFWFNRPFYTDWVCIPWGLGLLAALSGVLQAYGGSSGHPAFLFDLGFSLFWASVFYAGLPLLVRGIVRRLRRIPDGPILRRSRATESS